jgi:putative copper resistance protein D
LGVLITIHILCLAFWVGAFVPLARSARLDPPAHAGAIAHEFGQKALWVVGVLVLAGGGGLMILGAVTPDALSTPYGQFFAIKLILFAGVMCLAALNKLSLTPALVAAMPGANMRLRRSIQVETALIGAILAITATLTTISSP